MRMIKSRLHLIKNSFVFPACHATLRIWRAVSLSRTLLAFRTPILTDVQAAVNGRSCAQRCVWSRVRPGLQSSWTSSVRTRLHRPQLVSYGKCLPMGSGLRRERESGTQRRFNSPLKLGPEHSDCLVRRTKRTPTQIAERTRPVPPFCVKELRVKRQEIRPYTRPYSPESMRSRFGKTSRNRSTARRGQHVVRQIPLPARLCTADFA